LLLRRLNRLVSSPCLSEFLCGQFSFNLPDNAHFRSSRLTKMDPAEAVEFILSTANGTIRRVRPGMQVLKVSAKTAAGMSEWLQFLGFVRKRQPGN
jgi:hypothetical protein